MELIKFDFLLVLSITIFCIINSLFSVQARVNLPKSIQTKDGSIYDCIDIYQQPAFNHPLLKNHEIQMEPIFPKTTSSKGTTKSIRKNNCPTGTVPIKRISKENQQKFHLSFKQMSAADPPGVEFAGLSTKPHNYVSGGGTVNVYNPQVQPGQMSASVVSVEGGPDDEFSVIRAGWMVNPNMFRDNSTHLYTIWGQGENGQMHGCYGTQCPGFVQVTDKVLENFVFSHSSTPNGAQYYAKIRLMQDEKRNWWLHFTEDKNGEFINVGYWPAELFKHIQGGASVVRLGGMVFSGSGNKPPMGSGGKDCFFQDLTLGGLPATFEENNETGCYKVGAGPSGPNSSFWFGGPVCRHHSV